MVRIKRTTDVLYNTSASDGKITDLEHHKSLQEKDIRLENITEAELDYKYIYISHEYLRHLFDFLGQSVLSLVIKDEIK